MAYGATYLQLTENCAVASAPHAYSAAGLVLGLIGVHPLGLFPSSRPNGVNVLAKHPLRPAADMLDSDCDSPLKSKGNSLLSAYFLSCQSSDSCRASIPFPGTIY